MEKRRVICWDLDETLGDFRDPNRMRLTRGIAPLLEKLRGKGVINAIASSASAEHASNVLEYFRILPLFDRVFTGHEICDKEMNKHYMGVAECFDTRPKDAPHRMLVIGNLCSDAPTDLDLPFILHPSCRSCHADVLDILLTEMMELSDSWISAYRRLRFRNERLFSSGLFKGGTQMLEGIGIAVGFAFWNPRIGKRADSTIAVYGIPEKYKEEEAIQPACSLSRSQQPASQELPEHHPGTCT